MIVYNTKYGQKLLPSLVLKTNKQNQTITVNSVAI